MVISLKLLSNRIKKPFRSKENILAIYSPKKYMSQEEDTTTVDTGIIINLPTKSTAYVATEFKGQKIKEIRGPQKKRVRITLLNESYFQKHRINKDEVVGYLLSLDSEFCIHEKQKKKHNKIPENYLPKTWKWKKVWEKKSDRQEAS